MKYLPINKKKRRFYPLRMKTSLRYEKPRYYSVVLRKIIKEDTCIDSLDDLDAEVIENAPYIPEIFAPKEWGGVNQAIFLGDGKIGLIGHQSYNWYEDDQEYPVYVNTAIVYDYIRKQISEKKVIGVREDYPYTESKLKALCKCAFTTGILFTGGETVELYSGLSDVGQGVIVIPNPFQNVQNA